MISSSGSVDKRCCMRSGACVEGVVYCITCRCGQQYYLCPNHTDKVVKEAQHTYSKQISRKGTPLERISIIGHKNLNQILKSMASTTSAFKTTDCTGRLQVSDKITLFSKVNKKPPVSVKPTPSEISSASASSSHNLPASAGESHPNFKTTMCRYGNRCIYAEKCSFAHNESELRLPTYAVPAAPPSPESETVVVPTVSVGPGGGASVAVVNPITKSSSNELFIMQKDDFPGLPGSARSGARTAAEVVAGYSQSSPTRPEGTQNSPPTQPRESTVEENTCSTDISSRIPTAPPVPETTDHMASSSSPGSFSLSGLSKAIPELNGHEQSFPLGGMFSNHFQSSHDSHPSVNPNRGTMDGFGLSSAFGAGSMGGDVMSVSSLGGRMYNGHDSIGGSFLGDLAPQPRSNSFGGLQGGPASGYPQPGLAPTFFGGDVGLSSRLDIYSGDLSRQSAGPSYLGQTSPSLGPSAMNASLSVPPATTQQQQLQQEQLLLQRQQQMYQQQIHMQQQQYQQQQAQPPPQVAPAPAEGIDGDLVPPNTFEIVDWLRDSDMEIFRWSGNDRAWTEFAMHVPSKFHSFFASNLPTWQQHSNCQMWFDKDKLRGETQNFLVFRRGENGEESNHAMHRALELISHHFSFVLERNESKSTNPTPLQAAPMW